MVWNGIDSSSAIRAASTEVREDFVKRHLDTTGPISFALHTSIPECTSHNGTPTSVSDGSIFKPAQRAQQVRQDYGRVSLPNSTLDVGHNDHCMLMRNMRTYRYQPQRTMHSGSDMRIICLQC